MAVGDRAPNFAANGQAFYDGLDGRRFQLLLFDDQTALAHQFDDTLVVTHTITSAAIRQRYAVASHSFVLVRPDGIIADMGTLSSANIEQTLLRYLNQLPLATTNLKAHDD